jgi:CHAT domain-containing protein
MRRLALLLLLVLSAARTAAEGPRPAAASVETLLSQARAQQLAGNYEDAIRTLVEAASRSDAEGNAKARARIEAALGAALVFVGDRTGALTHLDVARELARVQGDAGLEASVEINRGHALAAEGRSDAALAAHEAAEKLARASGDTALAARARASAARTRLEAGQGAPAVRGDLDAALALAAEGPAPLDLRLHLGRTAARLAEDTRSVADGERAYRQLESVRAAASETGDRATESWALGFLGRLYEYQGRSEEALDLSRRAAFLAVEAGAPEGAYRWQWQSARLLAGRGESDAALAYYDLAVGQLARIRHELLRSEGAGISFEEDVRPVYLELADLLLRTAPPPSERAAYEQRLRRVRDVVEAQKGDELRDYFRDECVDQARERQRERPLEDVAAGVAVVYPVLLADRTELLLTLPSGMERVTIGRSGGELEAEVLTLRGLLEKRTTREFLPHAQRLYDNLLRPWLGRLDGSGIDTLVFVPDGALRTIPLGALHDGQRYLVERYAIAVVPGLTLVDPRPLFVDGAEVLLGGISQSEQGFAPLEHVSQELADIRTAHGGQVLLDDRFERSEIDRLLRKGGFTIVHFPTHAQFEDEAGKSFLLTHGDRYELGDLGDAVGATRFSKRPIELLALSACDTAVGTDRGALGLAGIAVKAGARSALGTLWSVNDEAARLVMTRFYQEVQKPKVTKAEALRRAQVGFLAEPKANSEPDLRHPFYWSAFLLINDWL